MQCFIPIRLANVFSKRSTMSVVNPLWTTSDRYFSAFGPIVRGNGSGSAPLNSFCAAAPNFARTLLDCITSRLFPGLNDLRIKLRPAGAEDRLPHRRVFLQPLALVPHGIRLIEIDIGNGDAGEMPRV